MRRQRQAGKELLRLRQILIASPSPKQLLEIRKLQFHIVRRMGKATGSRKCAPDDRLRVPTNACAHPAYWIVPSSRAATASRRASRPQRRSLSYAPRSPRGQPPLQSGQDEIDNHGIEYDRRHEWQERDPRPPL